METIKVKTWKKLLGEKCEFCTSCRYLDIYENGDLILEDGVRCKKWASDPSMEEWDNLLDDIQITRINEMYE